MRHDVESPSGVVRKCPKCRIGDLKNINLNSTGRSVQQGARGSAWERASIKKQFELRCFVVAAPINRIQVSSCTMGPRQSAHDRQPSDHHNRS